MLTARRLRTKMVYLLCLLLVLHSCRADIVQDQGQKEPVKDQGGKGAGHSTEPVSGEKIEPSTDSSGKNDKQDDLQPEIDAPVAGAMDDDGTVKRGSESDTASDTQSEPEEPPPSENVEESEDEEEEEEEEEDDDEQKRPDPKQADAAMNQIYKAMFQARRNQHKEAIETVSSMPDIEKQFKTVLLVLEKMHKIMTEQHVKLTQAGYSPGDPFPEDQSLKEGLSSVLENTAFFGDLLLHQPDMVHNILHSHRDWDMIMRWGLGLAQMSSVFSEKDQKMLNLAAQEMGIIDKDPDYINPYKDESRELRAKKKKVPTATLR